jgi:hypothetical protein
MFQTNFTETNETQIITNTTFLFVHQFMIYDALPHIQKCQDTGCFKHKKVKNSIQGPVKI